MLPFTQNHVVFISKNYDAFLYNANMEMTNGHRGTLWNIIAKQPKMNRHKVSEKETKSLFYVYGLLLTIMLLITTQFFL